MKISMYRAMGIGMLLAALLLVWEELSVTLHGAATFSSTFWFTLFSIIAMIIFAYAIHIAPDND
ncbi:MAG: hypothetical protein QXT39_06610 [Conexivisphaerales archaeon]